MKSIEAINAIIILVLGVLVILAVLGLFMGVWSPAKRGTSLQVATQNICRVINPAYCYPKGICDCRNIQHLPVYDFDADNLGSVNSHTPETPAAPCTGVWPTTYPGNDNFGELCKNYYGGPPFVGGYEAEFYDICLIKVCGCPRSASAKCTG
jgi:hypothetical protein